jgi:hypothetical protein
MNGVRTVREALLVQAFGELDTLLAKTAAVEQSLSIGTLRLEAAAAGLEAAGAKYGVEVAQLTSETKTALAAFIERRASTTTAETMTALRKTMQDAATLAFADQLAAPLRELANQLDRRRQKDVLTLRPLVAFGLAAVLLVAGIAAGALVSHLMQ